MNLRDEVPDFASLWVELVLNAGEDLNGCLNQIYAAQVTV
jgi:hypothetical protein